VTSAAPAPPLSTVPTLPGTTEPPTPLKSTATFGGGVSVHVTNIDYGTVTGSGPGVISGQPAVTFTLQITNDSPATIKIDTVQVNVTYGPDSTPAVPSNAQSTQPFSGSLAAGKSATGTYAFSIPVPEQNDVSMTVWYNQGQPTVVLTGSAH
jgi:hypothetical protein